MKMAQIIPGRRGSRSLVVVFDDGHTAYVNHTQGTFDKAISAISAGATDEQVRDIIYPWESMKKTLREQGIEIAFNRDMQHLGDLLLERGVDPRSIERVMVDVAQNPDLPTNELCMWVGEQSELDVLADGRLVGYKRTRANGDSEHLGYGEVTLNDQTTIYEHDHIPNQVGATISMPRERASAHGVCGRGFHIGTRGFASNFDVIDEGCLFAVAFRVRDAIDANYGKIRVTKYKVLRRVDNV